MRHKVRTVILLVVTPLNIFVYDVVIPGGVSEIIGKISAGDFDIGGYTGILVMTLVPMLINNLVVVRILDWLDWSLDAKCGEYLSQLAFDAVINQSMTFHTNHFSGSLTSQANKLASAFIDFKSNFYVNKYIFGFEIYFIITLAHKIKELTNCQLYIDFIELDVLSTIVARNCIHNFLIKVNIVVYAFSKS